MSAELAALANGLALAALWALLVRRAGPRHRIPLHAAMLLLAAALYVVFAARGGAWREMGVEAAGGLLFAAAAWAGVRRRSPRWIALGWALHPAWDVALHTAGAMERYTPAGYVAACVGFDLLLAVVLARGAADRSNAAAPLAARRRTR